MSNIPLSKNLPPAAAPRAGRCYGPFGADLISLKEAAGYTDTDERSTDVRVTDEPVEGLRRISLRDVAAVMCNKNVDDAGKVYQIGRASCRERVCQYV